MSLEQSIQDLTVAVKALTEVVMSARAVSQAAEQVKLPEGLKDPKAKKETAKAVDVAPEVPNGQQQTTTNTSPSSEPESAPVTYDDVKKATNALSAAKGREVTVDTLSRFGVKRATELDEGQWADYISYAEKVTADE